MPLPVRSISIFFSILLLATRLEASSMYTITEIGMLPGTTTSVATGINDLGQVVGYANSSGSPNLAYNPQSFLYSNGQTTPITPVGGGAANAINDSGVIVGGSNVGINNAGQVVGPAFQVPYTTTSNGVTTSSQVSFQPYAINDAGEMAGSIFKPASAGGGVDAAIYQDGKVVDLNQALGLGNQPSHTLAIDRAGDVVVAIYSLYSSSYTPTLLLYKADGSSQGFSLGEPYILPSAGQVGLNSAGQVVGGYGIFSNGQYTPLVDLIPPSSQTFWSNLQPTAINEEGQIVGTGYYTDQNGAYPAVAFLMTPMATPEPSTLALFFVSIASFLLRLKTLSLSTR